MNPLRGKTITVTYGLPGNILITKTGKFKDILSFSEGLEFLILSNDNEDTIISLGFIISWTVKSPPSDYVDLLIHEPVGEYIR